MGKTSITITEKYMPASQVVVGSGAIAMLLASKYGDPKKIYSISNTQDFEKVFGTDENSVAYKYANYLINRGHTLRLVTTARKAHVTSGANPVTTQPLAATVSFYYGAAESGTAGLKVDAVATGTGYNDAGIEIESMESGTATSGPKVFSIKVYRKITITSGATPTTTYGDLLETFSPVSLDINSPYYIGAIKSSVVTFTVSGWDASKSLFADNAAIGVKLTKVLAGGIGDVDNSAAAFGAAAEVLSDRTVMFDTLLIPDLNSADAKTQTDNLRKKRNDFTLLVDLTGSDTTSVVNAVASCRNTGIAAYYPKVNVPSMGMSHASIAIADLIANMFASGTFTKAPAGVPYGILDDVIDVEKDLSMDDIGKLQEAGINPIVIRTGIGCVVWGEDTTNTNPLEVSSLSTRITTNYFKQNIYQISNNYMFQDNNQATWDKWICDVESIAEPLKANNNIFDYKAQCGKETMSDTDIANGILRCAFRFTPVGKIKEIIIPVTITEYGVTIE